MKLEHPAETPETVETAQKPLPDRKRPVLVYIMILFIAAFLLMAFSFLMHRRSNEQVLGELHTSVNLLEDYQQALEANNRLTGQVADLEKELSAAKSDTTKQETEKNTLKTQLDAAKQEISALQQQIAALEALAKAQTLYRNGEYAACRDALSAMESAGQDKLLPAVSADAYQQLKAADFPEN